MLALLDLTACFAYVRFQTLPVKSILRADLYPLLSFNAGEEQRLHFEQRLQAAFLHPCLAPLQASGGFWAFLYQQGIHGDTWHGSFPEIDHRRHNFLVGSGLRISVAEV